MRRGERSSHDRCMFDDAHDVIDLRWYAPVLPDRVERVSGPDSPLTRRALEHLALRSGERLLVLGARDARLVETAADLVGRSGRVRCLDPSESTLRRLGRHLSSRSQAELVEGGPWGNGAEGPDGTWDAIVWVHRHGLVPDPAAIRRLVGLLGADGRLVVVAFHAPAGRVARVGCADRRHRNDRRDQPARRRDTPDVAVSPDMDVLGTCTGPAPAGSTRTGPRPARRHLTDRRPS